MSTITRPQSTTQSIPGTEASPTAEGVPQITIPRPERPGRPPRPRPQEPPPLGALVAPHWGLTPFLDPLPIPRTIRARGRKKDLTIRTSRVRRRLHAQLPPTVMWGYEGQVPGPTIEVDRDQHVTITWANDTEGTIPLTGVVTGDIPGMQQPGGWDRSGETPVRYTPISELEHLRAWNVVHLHGAMTNGYNDGWATSAVARGSAQRGEYPNRQHATALWYHDHAMDVTRFNVHAGLAGMYLIRDEEERSLDLPSGDAEIPLVLRDGNLDTDAAGTHLTGDLLYKVADPALDPEAERPWVDAIPVSGPFTLVNGVIWPHLDVRRRWYRLRVLNAANARTYRLGLVDEDDRVLSSAVHVIGTDGGLLPAPAPMPAGEDGGLVIAPAERLDLLVDLTELGGQRLRLVDLGTRITIPAEGEEEARETWAHVMQLRVSSGGRSVPFRLPERLARSFVRLEHGSTVPDDHAHPFVALVPPGTGGNAHPEIWELGEVDLAAEGAPAPGSPGVVQLTDPSTQEVRTFQVLARIFHDTATFFFEHGDWTVWNFVHLGGPPHPMHIHMAEFQMLTRRRFALAEGTNVVAGFDTAVGTTPAGAPLPVPGDGAAIAAHEQGWKDTFVVRPGEWVTVAGHLEGANGNFMYHCHILDHEDAGMMRPFMVRPADVAAFDMHATHDAH